MVHTETNTHSTRSTAKAIDVKPIRQEVREALKRADLTIVKSPNGEASGDPAVGKLPGKLFSYQVEGTRVEDSTARYYTNSRFEKLSEKLGVHVELRRVRRNASEVFVDVFASEEDADAARHAEDVRKAEKPSTPASKYYYRAKAGLTGKGKEQQSGDNAAA